MFYSLAPSHFFSYQKQLRKQVKALEQPGSRNPRKISPASGGLGGQLTVVTLTLLLTGIPKISYKPQISSVQNNNRQEKIYFGGLKHKNLFWGLKKHGFHLGRWL